MKCTALPVLDCSEPHWLGWETGGGVEVSHQFGLCFQLVTLKTASCGGGLAGRYLLGVL